MTTAVRRWAAGSSRAATILALVLFGCHSGRRAPLHFEVDAAALLAPDALDFDVVWEQRVTAQWTEGEALREHGFRAVIQKHAGTLQIVGMSPANTVGFVLSFDGDEVTFENRTGRAVEFPPGFILLDVQRAFYPWLGKAPAEQQQRRDGVVLGEQVTERWREGRIQERSFVTTSGPRPGRVTVHYEWSDGEWTIPRRVRLENERLGYRLIVETLKETLLMSAEGAAEGGPLHRRISSTQRNE